MLRQIEGTAPTAQPNPFRQKAPEVRRKASGRAAFRANTARAEGAQDFRARGTHRSVVQHRRFFRAQHSPGVPRNALSHLFQVVDAGAQELETGDRRRTAASALRNAPAETAQGEQRERVFEDLPDHPVEVPARQFPAIRVRDDFEAPRAGIGLVLTNGAWARNNFVRAEGAR